VLPFGIPEDVTLCMTRPVSMAVIARSAHARISGRDQAVRVVREAHSRPGSA
jgi:hypothetical protein